VSRVRVPIAFTRIDRWLIGLLVAAGAAVAFLLWLSEAMIAPPRPRVSDSERPTIGLAVEADAGALRVTAATGPAHEAGLRRGDRIVAIDGKKAMTAGELAELVSGADDDRTVNVEARRRRGGGDETAVMTEVKVVRQKVSPADQGLQYDDVSFPNADGLALRGWYIPPPADGNGRAPAIAYGHGNAADRRHWLPVALAVHEAGFAQLLFDFTGRGESDGEVITLGVHEAGDLRAALDTLAAKPEVDPMRLAVAGRSMGAAAALFLAANDARVKALVLDSPYADLTALVNRVLAGEHLPPFIVRPMLFAVAGWRAHYTPGSVRPVDAIRKVKVPILLLHGDKDTLVPFEDALALKAAAGGKLTLVTLTGLDHNTPRPEAYRNQVVAFLSHTLPDTWRTP
jgi:dipeptidyl aminopeptidase/acylaminoacyl peptidase